MRWLIAAGSISLGLVLPRLSYAAHAKWHEYLALGDASGAEAYEVEFWPEAVAGVVLVLVGGFVAGWAAASQRRR